MPGRESIQEPGNLLHTTPTASGKIRAVNLHAFEAYLHPPATHRDAPPRKGILARAVLRILPGFTATRGTGYGGIQGPGKP